MPRKPYRSDVTDAHWGRIKPLVPKPAPTGRPREDMPHDIAVSPKTCNRRLLEYQRRRVWQRRVADLLRAAARRGMLNLKNCYHDASVVKSQKGRIPRSGTPENTGLKG